MDDPEYLEFLTETYRTDPIQATAYAITQGGEDGVKHLAEDIEEYVPKKDKVAAKAIIYAEFVFFYIHLMNRSLHAELGDTYWEAAEKIIQSVLEVTVDEIHHFYKELNRVELMKYLYDKLNEAESLYATSTSYAGKDNKDPSATVNQFRSRVYRVFGEIDFMKELQLMTHVSSATTFLMLVDFDEWVKGPIAQLGLKKYDSVKLFDDERSARIAKNIEEIDKNLKTQRHKKN